MMSRELIIEAFGGAESILGEIEDVFSGWRVQEKRWCDTILEE